uniref:Ubiquitin-like protease family profile domain-containing protein n=2 Tax=Brassica oleracea TaxID=3712 RepID=A0A0D3BLA6_BRAOL
SESVSGAKAGQNGAQESSSSKELGLVIAKEPEVNLTFLYWTKEHPLFPIYSRGKLESRQKRLRLWNLSVERENSTAKLIIPNKRVGQGYDLFVPFDKKMSKVLTDKYPEFKSVEGDLNGLGRRLPGLWVDVDDIYAPLHFRNEHWIAMWISIPKRHTIVWDSIVSHICREDLDVVMELFVTMVPYLLVECAVSDEQHVQPTLEPYTYERVTVGVPVTPPNRSRHRSNHRPTIKQEHDRRTDRLPRIRALHDGLTADPAKVTKTSLASRDLYKLATGHLKQKRVRIPQCRFGDCGVFTLKYIECHALGMSFPPEFCNKNAKAIREKIALDIFKVTPECHSKENKDNDENMRTYDSQVTFLSAIPHTIAMVSGVDGKIPREAVEFILQLLKVELVAGRERQIMLQMGTLSNLIQDYVGERSRTESRKRQNKQHNTEPGIFHRTYSFCFGHWLYRHSCIQNQIVAVTAS